MKLGPNQKAWLEALRSGEFKQAEGSLCINGKYCCLGVGLVVLQRLGYGVDIDEEIDFDGEPTGKLSFNNETDELPEELVPELGLQDTCGSPLVDEFENEDGLSTCIDMNDSDKLTFEQIADALEKHADKYFVESV